MASLHHFIITSLLLLLLLSPNLSSASISTTLTQPLSGKKRLISQSGNFELGFFQPANSSCYYMGIWYNLDKISPLTSVWVANRDNPITDPTTAELKISADGNLVVLSNNSINPIIWSTNLTTTSNLTTVVSLLDTGNLVIKDGSDSNITLWQSFDHPTDTWLPGGKLGLNKLTGELQHLVSWKSQNDPASGVFSLEVDPNGTSEYFLLWNNSYKYWNTGTWNGKIFSLLPEMTGNNGYTFQYVSNDHENYFTYSVTAADIITRLILDVSGQVEQLLWVDGSREWIAFWSQPRAQCQVHALCGPFGSCNENDMPLCSCVKGFREKLSTNWDLGDRTGGCVRNTPLSPQCAGNGSYQTGKEDGFFPMSNMRLPDNAKTLLQVGSESDCGQECLQTCSCTAYSYSSSSSSTGGCLVWHGDLLNLQEEYVGRGEGTLFLRLSANDINPNPKRRKGIVTAAVIGGGVVVLLLLTILVIVWLLISKRRGILMGKFSVVQGGLVVFKFTDLQRATKNFTVKLGGGGFGAVFRGVLQDSTVVAVKKLEGVVQQQGEKQFRAEVSTIGTIQHVNLIRLRGFCSEGSHKLLVYEYMPGGSLDTHLFKQYSSAGGEVLGWKTRYLIALGIARALTYLHEHCRDCIIHCDIKPENILLDASFVPKLADFGLAKLLGRDLSRVLTTMRGTRGYLAPEWFAGVEITAKADVYSYGMMLFEIISGKRNLDESEEEKPGFFPTLAARKLMDGDELVSLLDCEMDSSDVNSAEVIRACKVACWCIQDHENSRPTMSQVVQILEGVLEVNMPPIPRSLQILVENPGSVILS